MMSSEIL